MNKWDERFLGLAKTVASWSKDPSSQVGAVITDRRNRVLSLGYNGPPRYADDTFISREQKLLRTIHAEQNAILFSHTPLDGTTIYVTHTPCARCASVIVQSGIARVVANQLSPEFAERWKDDITEAMKLFGEAGVIFQGVRHANE